MNKWLKITILPLLLLLLMPLLPFPVQASGESVTAQISFTVENAPGIVVMEAVSEGAPMPEQTVFENVSEGAYQITFAEPGEYLYNVYQQKGTEPGISYDMTTVYEVGIYVTVESNGELIYSTGINKKGSTSKAEAIVFENVPLYAYLEITKVAKIDGSEIVGMFSGNEFLYEISVENIGQAPATNVVITDTLPTELPLLTVGTINDGGQLSTDGKSITWTVGDIPVGGSRTVSFTVLVPQVWAETRWVNTAVATYSGAFVMGDASGMTTTVTAVASAVVTVSTPTPGPGESPAPGTPGDNDPDTPGNVNPGTPGDNSPGISGNDPKTGDNSHIGIWFVLMIGSLTGLILLYFAGRKIRDKR